MKRILTSQSSEHISTNLEQVNKVATHTPAHIPPEVYHEIEKYIWANRFKQTNETEKKLQDSCLVKKSMYFVKDQIM